MLFILLLSSVFFASILRIHTYEENGEKLTKFNVESTLNTLLNEIEKLKSARLSDRMRMDQLYLQNGELLKKLNSIVEKNSLDEDEVFAVDLQKFRTPRLKSSQRRAASIHPDVVIIKSLEESRPVDVFGYVEEAERRIEVILNRTESMQQKLSEADKRIDKIENALSRLVNNEQKWPTEESARLTDELYSGNEYSGSGVDSYVEGEFQKVDASYAKRYERLIGMFDRLDSQIGEHSVAINRITRKLFEVPNSILARLGNVQNDFTAALGEIKNSIDNDVFKNLNQTRRLALNVQRVQMDHYDIVQSCLRAKNQMETTLLRYGEKLNHMQVVILNGSYANLWNDNSRTKLNLQISDLKLDMNALQRRMMDFEKMVKDAYLKIRQKADYGQLKEFAKDLLKYTEQVVRVQQLNNTVIQMNRQISKLEDQLPVDCTHESPAQYAVYNSGLYLIKPEKMNSTVRVYCDMDNGGWTLIQRRLSNLVSFNQSWLSYKNGFGNLSESFWLGNDAVHFLTNGRKFRMRVEVVDIYDDVYFAEYDHFALGSEKQGYPLTLGNYVGGNLTDSFVDHNGMRFSTFDVDNDASSTHCGKFYACGWWFTQCQTVNLNGNFNIGITWFNGISQRWLQMKKTIMKIKPTLRLYD